MKKNFYHFFVICIKVAKNYYYKANLQLLGSTLFAGKYILCVLTHTTAWDPRWGGDEILKLKLASLML